MPRAELRIRRLGIRVPPSALGKSCSTGKYRLGRTLLWQPSWQPSRSTRIDSRSTDTERQTQIDKQPPRQLGTPSVDDLDATDKLDEPLLYRP
jgi:hypothetical protein